MGALRDDIDKAKIRAAEIRGRTRQRITEAEKVPLLVAEMPSRGSAREGTVGGEAFASVVRRYSPSLRLRISTRFMRGCASFTS